MAVAALLGILITMLAPSLQGANDKVKNSRLKNDLATIDQAIQLYKMENGKCPEVLSDLDHNYLAGKSDFKDAANEVLSYTVDADGMTYILKGKNASGTDVISSGSKTES